ncbi:MAG: hypothetical protein H0X30_32385 [Anaerolineae bacterium]|nr:hypothetical protein [Anaerolineae bacterium]
MNILSMYRGRIIKFGFIAAISAVVPFVALSAPVKQAATEPVIFNITMSEYKFAVDGQKDGDPIRLETGKPYRFIFHNIGTSQHEALIGQKPKIITGGFKHDFTTNLLEDVETTITNGQETSGFTIGAAGLAEFELLTKQDIAIEFTLPDDKVGDWEMGCFVSLDPNATDDNPGAGHYDVGMHLPVTVVKGSA